MVAAYRLYRLDSAGKIARSFWVEAESDEEAQRMAAAEHPAGHYELWLYNRHVADLRDGEVTPLNRPAT